MYPFVSHTASLYLQNCDNEIIIKAINQVGEVNRKNRLFFLVSVFPQPFFTLVGSHFMSFSFLTTWHNFNNFLIVFQTVYILPDAVLHCCILHQSNSVFKCIDGCNCIVQRQI